MQCKNSGKPPAWKNTALNQGNLNEVNQAIEFNSWLQLGMQRSSSLVINRPAGFYTEVRRLKNAATRICRYEVQCILYGEKGRKKKNQLVHIENFEQRNLQI